MIAIAKVFGTSLDQDNFELTASVLSDDCIYIIGTDTLTGPLAICNSYEENMLAGRKKLDELQWGESKITRINENQFHVHFTDYLTHQNKKYTHRCQQKLSINSLGKISEIEHIHDQEEQDRLDAYYRIVGLKE
ncbi:MAG: hypothetical protein GQ574_02455 [Crocinitomix sp.]|nr:hypothetical protein [Crocinitomix sp.]